MCIIYITINNIYHFNNCYDAIMYAIIILKWIFMAYIDKNSLN